MDNPLTLGNPQTSLHGSRSLADFFFDVIRPPESFQFVGDVIPILHGEPRKQRRPSELARRRLSRVRGRRSQRTFAHHHNGHGDAVIGAIDICVSKSVEEIELLTTFPQVAATAASSSTSGMCAGFKTVRSPCPQESRSPSGAISLSSSLTRLNGIMESDSSE